MKISDAIRSLENIQLMHGNLTLRYYGPHPADGTCDFWRISNISYDQDQDEGVACFEVDFRFDYEK